MQCIICREDKEKMSDEHVIPESLGGFYHIFNVCRICNSEMGQKVDSPLVNHKLTELYRFSEEIEGKSGSVPNPFRGIFVEDENPEVTARVDVGVDGKLEVLYHPVIRLKEEGGIVQSIEIEVDTKNEEEIDKILKKIIKRKGIPESDIVQGERCRKVRTGGVGGRWEIDILKFKIGLLKIAYEFAVDSIEKFFEDEDAIRISKILRDANYEAVRDYVKIGSGLQPEVFHPFSDYLDLSSKKHYLVLTSLDAGLVCFVKLHDLFSIGVVLTKKKLLDFTETIIGINDIEERSFRKIGIESAVTECMGPIHTRFCYHFSDELEAEAGQLEINSQGFRYEGNDKAEIPLFKKNGERYPFFVHEILEGAPCESRNEGAWTVNMFDFGLSSEYFVKAVVSGNLYRIVAYEISQEIVKKI